MDYAIDNSFYMKAKALLDKVEQNQRLQQLAMSNGIDVKNSTKLSDATKDNVATAVIALLLAKHNNDPRYNDLVRYGMDHRKTKIEIINDYKDQANQIITRAKNGNVDELSGFTESYMESDDTDIEVYQEGIILNILGGVLGLVAGISVIVIGILVALICLIVDAIRGLVNLITGKKSIKSLINKLEKLKSKNEDYYIYNFIASYSFNDIIGRIKNRFGNSSPLVKALTYGRTTMGISLPTVTTPIPAPIMLSSMLDVITNYTLETFDGTEATIKANETIWEQFGSLIADIADDMKQLTDVNTNSDKFSPIMTLDEFTRKYRKAPTGDVPAYISIDMMIADLKIIEGHQEMQAMIKRLFNGAEKLASGLKKLKNNCKDNTNGMSDSNDVDKYWANTINRNTNKCSKVIAKSTQNMVNSIYKILKYSEANLNNESGVVTTDMGPFTFDQVKHMAREIFNDDSVTKVTIMTKKYFNDIFKHGIPAELKSCNHLIVGVNRSGDIKHIRGLGITGDIDPKLKDLLGPTEMVVITR